MRGSLGEKIGEGVFADVHAWAPGQVVKLLKAGVPRRASWREARMTRAVFAAGGPAPEVFGEVELEGRFGIVLSRFDGPTLLQLTRSGAITFEQAGAILASLCLSVHKTPPPPEIPFVRDKMDSWLRSSGAAVPKHIATGILALLERLRPGDGLCHTDLHPGNVIMTADGPRILDWGSALRASGVFDIARAHVSLSELVPEDVDPELPRAINAAVQSGYAQLAGMSGAALTVAMQPYLPILRAFVLLQRRPATSAQRERLIQRIEAALRSDGLI
jgi:aminoglycoside phosphotransferase (APT) family kinase protein